MKKLDINYEDLFKNNKGKNEQKGNLQAQIVNLQERLDSVIFQFKTLQKCL